MREPVSIPIAGERRYTDSTTATSEDVDQFVWEHPDMTILFSAGNDGIDDNTFGNADGVVDLDSIGSPATAKNCITVGASENNRPSLGTKPTNFTWGPNFGYPAAPILSDYVSDNINGMAAFSSRGPDERPSYIARYCCSGNQHHQHQISTWRSAQILGRLQQQLRLHGRHLDVCSTHSRRCCSGSGVLH